MPAHIAKLSLIFLLCSTTVYAETSSDKNDEVNVSASDSSKAASSEAKNQTPSTTDANKLTKKSEVKTRALGNALAKTSSTQNNADETRALQRRIEELEVIVAEQKKLIELYKSGNE